jgi:hypothetical protein
MLDPETALYVAAATPCPAPLLRPAPSRPGASNLRRAVGGFAPHLSRDEARYRRQGRGDTLPLGEPVEMEEAAN